MSLKAIALAVALAAVVSSASAAEVAGLWRAPTHNAVVRVEACGDAICGYIVSSDRLKANRDLTDEKNRDPKLRARPLQGLALFYGLRGGPPKWSGGHIYNPDDGGTYTASVELVGERLVLRGCLAGFLCQSQQWFRTTDADVAQP
jgi:uncharacterized protein (DUF2147 family)